MENSFIGLLVCYKNLSCLIPDEQKFITNLLLSVSHVCVYTHITEPKLDHGIKVN